MILTRALPRGTDDYGSGDYGAGRGTRKHRGIDYKVDPGQQVISHVSGRVTKLGYPYASDLSYRYVEVTDAFGLRHRFFYVEPTVKRGAWVEFGKLLGVAQDIASRYTSRGQMVNHVHYEIIDQKGDYLNPESVYG